MVDMMFCHETFNATDIQPEPFAPYLLNIIISEQWFLPHSQSNFMISKHLKI